MSSSLPPSQTHYRPSYASDAADSIARSIPLTPTRGDATELVANFQTWNNEGAVGPHEMVAEQHESTYRNYESRILRVSEPVPAPTRTATLLEDRRGATGPKLPQGCNAYISHERWKRTAPSVLPADGCAMSPLTGQLQQLHNSSVISDPYHLISKSDTTIEARMFSAISSSSPAYAGKSFPPTPPPMYDQLTHRVGDYAIDYTGPVDAYIDLGLTPAGGEYSYHDASFSCATTLNQAQTSRRQSTSSTQSSIRSPPPSLYRDSSSSPSSIFEELSTPSFGPLEYACMSQQFVSPQSCNPKACGSVESATVAAPHLAYSNILHPENRANGSQLIPDINAWLQNQDPYAFTEQHAPIASTSTAQPPQPCASYGLPPAAFMQPQPAAMPDLQHPRPKRAFTPAWQEQTEFDLAEFVKSSPRSAVASSPIWDATQQVYPFYSAPSHAETVGQERFEDMDEDDAMDEDEDEDEEDWEFEDDAELDQSIMNAEPCALLPHDCHATGPSNATLGMGSGSRMGRGFSTQPLNPQSLLFQPVADYVRCPDLAPGYVPTSAQEYVFTYTSTC